MPTVCHFIFGLAGAVLSGIALWAGAPALLSGILVGLTNLYLIAILVEAALRSGKAPKSLDGLPRAKTKVMFEMPHRVWNLFQVFLLLFIVLCGFANMYIKEGGVVYQGPTLVVQHATSNQPAKPNPPLAGRLDAVYFSMVTTATLGYGDFVPATEQARKLVIWELATDLLLLAGIFPLLISRLADL